MRGELQNCKADPYALFFEEEASGRNKGLYGVWNTEYSDEKVKLSLSKSELSRKIFHCFKILTH